MAACRSPSRSAGPGWSFGSGPCSTSAMDLLPIYRSAVRQFDARVQVVRPQQWSTSTPDTDWDVHHLVRHVILGQANVPDLLAGRVPARLDIGATTPGPELAGHWTTASTAAIEAFTALASLEPPVDLPDGTVPATELGWRLAVDLTVHAWDLARAIDAQDEFPNDLLGHVLDQAKQSADRWFPATTSLSNPAPLSPGSVSAVLLSPMAPSSSSSATRRYAPPIPVPGCTDDLTELLALTGRNRWWRRT